MMLNVCALLMPLVGYFVQFEAHAKR